MSIATIIRLLLLLCGLALSTRASAQDTILMTDGEELPGKVLTITPEVITYVKSATDTIRLAASQVFLIRYPNGTKDVIQHPPAPTAPTLSREAAYAQGRHDARAHFKAPGVFWGTYATTVATGYGGVATGLAMALVPPAERNLQVPDAALLRNPNYVAGYRRQAQNKKLGSAAGGFGAGVGTMAVVLAVLLSAYGLH
ncbi:hypothetical protein [Hymenobacter pini]|uniref:hypothetical protein n=1 Tax=Hymenobacter pini TaxID=2880879 RepID=UPI001CF0F1E1|nr:hypothetical protein [Hymenobacter pini]MCA8833090.1 hypothetical protein [Hymenobacter pini]